MKRKETVLWIEDGARGGLSSFLNPLFIAGFDPQIAEDATAGERMLYEVEFSAVIVDIRLVPGEDKRWIQLYQSHKNDAFEARLGSALLRSLFLPESAEVKPLGEKPTWLTPGHVAVFSVETQKELEDVSGLGLASIQSKEGVRTERVLLEIVESIVRSTSQSGGGIV